MGDAEHELVLDGRHPGVVVQLQDGAGAEEVEAAEAGREDSQPVALEVQLPQPLQLTNLLRHVHQLIARICANYKANCIAKFIDFYYRLVWFNVFKF